MLASRSSSGAVPPAAQQHAARRRVASSAEAGRAECAAAVMTSLRVAFVVMLSMRPAQVPSVPVLTTVERPAFVHQSHGVSFVVPPGRSTAMWRLVRSALSNPLCHRLSIFNAKHQPWRKQYCSSPSVQNAPTNVPNNPCCIPVRHTLNPARDQNLTDLITINW